MSIGKVHVVLALAIVAASCKAPTGGNSPSGDRAWVVSTLAGSSQDLANGVGTSAHFNRPYGVAVDLSGNVYVADRSNHRIRKIVTAEDGAVTVSTLAGSGATSGTTGVNGGGFADTDADTSAQFDDPSGVAVDSSGNVYVADKDNNRIRKVTAEGEVSTLAGDGSKAQFDEPHGVAVDRDGNVYVGDTNNHRIRKIVTAEDGTVTVSTLAGSEKGEWDGWGFADGAGSSALFNVPRGVAVDSSGNVYVADKDNHRIRKIVTAEDGAVTVSTLAGSGTRGHKDGPGSSAQFYQPIGIAVDSSGNVYVADAANHRIRKITITVDGTTGAETVTVSTLAGSGAVGYFAGGFADGPGSTAQFDSPAGVAVSSNGSVVYVGDYDNHRIRKLEYKVVP